MNRLYAVEATPTVTGAISDHRFRMKPSEVAAFARALAAQLGVDAGPAGAEPSTRVPPAVVAAVAHDLKSHAGRSIVVAGREQPPFVHAAAHAINAALGNVGRTVVYTDPVEARSVDHAASIRELASDMEAGRVDLLFIVGANPAYDAPADLAFAQRMEKVGLRVHLGLYDDETSARCHWHVPQAHDLESWSDARAYDGTVTILQPLIEPLYGGKTPHELMAAFSAKPFRSAREIVREHWSKSMPAGAGFEPAWRRALHDGLVAGSALPEKTPALRREWWSAAGASAAAAPTAPASAAATAGGLEVVFRPDAATYDGRYANNGWLQETPRPLTKITWDNAALVSPATAAHLGLASEDLVDLSLGERTVRAPVWVLPGHADDTVTLHLGYGRERTGRVGTGTGFSAYRLRTSAAPWIAGGAELRRTGARYPIATTQEHHSMEGRAIVRSATLEEARKNPEFAHHAVEAPGKDLTLYPPHEYKGHAWGMAIDLASCIGCNACAVACQAENNVPVVGKDQVARGREMAWIRIDRYFEGSADDPETWHQPVLCMHCENAPCELVCPVAATVHSSEGLNDMVYNRCVGTRYCSNNCPYKVRRFNFLQFADYTTPSLKLLRNPDVTVRTRGVMEKCTYCVQRINHARNDAEVAGRPIRDGEITTACQQACPAGAIVFGDINDPASRVSRLKADPRNYGLLEETGTRPRTTYLAALRNPNPEIRGDLNR